MTTFGIGSPTGLHPCERQGFLLLVTTAEACGFRALAVIDRMDYDLWDPLGIRDA